MIEKRNIKLPQILFFIIIAVVCITSIAVFLWYKDAGYTMRRYKVIESNEYGYSFERVGEIWDDTNEIHRIITDYSEFEQIFEDLKKHYNSIYDYENQCYINSDGELSKFEIKFWNNEFEKIFALEEIVNEEFFEEKNILMVDTSIKFVRYLKSEITSVMQPGRIATVYINLYPGDTVGFLSSPNNRHFIFVNKEVTAAKVYTNIEE